MGYARSGFGKTGRSRRGGMAPPMGPIHPSSKCSHFVHPSRSHPHRGSSHPPANLPRPPATWTATDIRRLPLHLAASSMEAEKDGQGKVQKDRG